MNKYVNNMESFPEIFEKIKFTSEKYGSNYTAILFKLKNDSIIHEFQEFLLKYLRISDTVFSYNKTKVLVILEETSIRWAIVLNEKLREKINEKWFKYDYFCAAMQWDFIDSHEKLIKSLNKRLKIAKECSTSKCVHSLSCAD